MKKPVLGMKGSTSNVQIENRLSFKDLAVYEFHLAPEDLIGKRKVELEHKIQYLKSKGIKVYMHHPAKINGTLLHVLGKDTVMANFFEMSTRIIVEICEKYDCYTIVHWNYGVAKPGEVVEVPANENPTREDLEKLLERTLEIDKTIGKGRILWESGCMGIGAYRQNMLWASMLANTDVKLTFDTSHAFISLEGSNEHLLKTMDMLFYNIEYYHVVDSMGLEHDSLMVGDGKINWTRVLPYVVLKPSIQEIVLDNQEDGSDMVESYNRLVQEWEERKAVPDINEEVSHFPYMK